MTEYICRECTGRAGEERTFELDEEPSHCPWCGNGNHISTMKNYLRTELQRAGSDAEYWKDMYKELAAEIESKQLSE